MSAIEPTEPSVSAGDELSVGVIALLKGVVYQESEPATWSYVIELQSHVREYVAVLGLELVLDEAEGYAFLRSRDRDEDESTARQPRLIARRQLSFPVSLLLALLRKKLAESDAGGGETRLVLSREEVVELVRVFLPESSNEARMMDKIETHINKIVDLGFLRRLKPAVGETTAPASFEVRRILKAFVDAQWLAQLDVRLAEYRARLEGNDGDTSDDRS